MRCRHRWHWWLSGADAAGARPVGWLLTALVNLGWLPIWGVVELYLILVSAGVLAWRAHQGEQLRQLCAVPVGLGWFVLDNR